MKNYQHLSFSSLNFVNICTFDFALRRLCEKQICTEKIKPGQWLYILFGFYIIISIVMTRTKDSLMNDEMFQKIMREILFSKL